MERQRLVENSLYDEKFFSSGSTMLDLALGGGWALGRVFNIVGDKSTGKTLLAIEAFANLQRQYKGKGRYAEAEAAFDERYAETLGFPPATEKPEEPLITVQQFQQDAKAFAAKGGPSLYILDSLDALSDDAELKKFNKELKEGEEVKGSYGADKAKEMSKMFRILTRTFEKTDAALGIISQIRDNIGVMFGETKTRSGGRALDFYASQIVWLSETGKITREYKGQKRVVGVSIRAKVKKCKVGTPFREADFDIIFGYGIDDEDSIIDFLVTLKEMSEKEASEMRGALKKSRKDQDYKYIAENITAPLKLKAKKTWESIEKTLAPPMRKYQPL